MMSSAMDPDGDGDGLSAKARRPPRSATVPTAAASAPPRSHHRRRTGSTACPKSASALRVIRDASLFRSCDCSVSSTSSRVSMCSGGIVLLSRPGARHSRARTWGLRRHVRRGLPGTPAFTRTGDGVRSATFCGLLGTRRLRAAGGARDGSGCSRWPRSCRCGGPGSRPGSTTPRGWRSAGRSVLRRAP